MIAYLLTKIVKDINDEKIPNLSDIFKEMIVYNIDKNYNLANDYFKEKLEKLKSEELDLDMKEIYSIKYDAIKEFMNILEKYPEITKKEIYLKEYQIRKEKLEIELENQIKKELNILISNDSFDQIYNKKDKDNIIYKKSDDMIEDYLNELSEFKINSDSTIVNNKDYDNFVKYDIKKTKNIIDFIEKNKEFSLKSKNNIIEEERFKTKETDNKNNNDEVNDDKDYQKLKKELENTEKNALELIGKFTKLLDKRDKYVKQGLRPSLHFRHSIKSYSTKLVNIYYNEEKLELNSEEKPAEKCNCSLDRLKNCFIY